MEDTSEPAVVVVRPTRDIDAGAAARCDACGSGIRFQGSAEDDQQPRQDGLHSKKGRTQYSVIRWTPSPTELAQSGWRCPAVDSGRRSLVSARFAT